MSPSQGVLRFAFAMSLTGLAVVAIHAARPEGVAFPPPGSAFALDVAPGQRLLRIGVRSATSEPTQVTIVDGDRQASFLTAADGRVAYRIALPTIAGAAITGAPRSVRVEAQPQASVVAMPGSGRRVTRRPLRWEPAAPPLQVAPPRSATAGTPYGEATIDETDTFGLRLFGVPVRSAPRTSAPVVATVSHGDRLRASCWAVGDTVSNGFDELPFDDAFTYTSAVWFRVNTPSGPGFVPDVRFGRRGGTDRLGLPSCGGG